MSIKFSCPRCQKHLFAKDELAGKKVQCTGCKSVCVVPVPVAKPAMDVEDVAAAAFAIEEKAVAAAPSAKIEFVCPMCDEKISVNGELAGKRAPCPSCSRIISVPALEKKGPTDWRKMDTRLPAGARRDDVKLEGTWGTESASIVSREALEEAKALPIQKKKLTWPQLIRRGVLAAAVLGLAGLGIWLTFSMRSQNLQAQSYAEASRYLAEGKGKIPADEAAELLRLAGLYELGENKLDKARPLFQEARLAASASKGQEGSERDLVLIDLAFSQIGLGGEKSQVQDGIRLKWEDVQNDLRQTLQLLGNADARQEAFRELTPRLAARKQTREALALAGLFGDERVGLQALVALELLRAQKVEEAEAAAQEILKSIPAAPPPAANKPGVKKPVPPATLVALWYGLGQQGKARALAPEPKDSAEAASQYGIGLAWGFALVRQWKDAQRVARLVAPSQARIAAYAAIAQAALDAGDTEAARFAVDDAVKIAVAEKGKDISSWQLRWLARLAAKEGSAEQALVVARLIADPSLRNRTLVDLAQPGKKSPADVEKALGTDVPRDSTAYGLALYESARYAAQQGDGPAVRTAISSWSPEKLRPFGYLGLALGLQEHNQ